VTHFPEGLNPLPQIDDLIESHPTGEMRSQYPVDRAQLIDGQSLLQDWKRFRGVRHLAGIECAREFRAKWSGKQSAAFSWLGLLLYLARLYAKERLRRKSRRHWINA
jgi:hypothetical protein